MKKTLLVFSTLFSIILLLAMMPPGEDPRLRYHTAEEIESFGKQIAGPLLPGQYFHLPEACKGCHGFDSLGFANVDSIGHDINLYDDWETSMMGLSAVDPFWRAKVRHEILVDTAHANQLQTLCTSCHAPMGHYTALYLNQPYYTLANLANDSLGKAGVSCMACHIIGSEGLGETFSGEIPYDTNHIEYGPYETPISGPMQLYVGMTPAYSEHMGESRVCSPCHTLITNSVDLNGVPTGTKFVEQATFHEWQNSDYPSLQKQCQTCHMPQLLDSIVIANGTIALQPRPFFNLHEFAGANSFMVNLIKKNKNSLGVKAPDANFDSTLKAIERMLLYKSITVEASKDTVINDTAYFDVTLTNKAGHKFPSGYPSRRSVLQLIATKPNGDTLFASGLFNSNNEVMNYDAPFESHYNIINNASQVQVYEMVMGDVNSNKTTVLERAFTMLKDNRLAPLGFTTFHSAYDTCKIVGDATSDPDFNLDGLTQGTGKDIVHYHIPLNGYTGKLNVSASVFYQTLPADFLTEMFSYSAPEIDSFQQYFANADRSPIMVANDTLRDVITVGISSISSASPFTITPTASANGLVWIYGEDLEKSRIVIYDIKGQQISFNSLFLSPSSIQLNLPSASGIYFINVSSRRGSVTKKVIRL